MNGDQIISAVAEALVTALRQADLDIRPADEPARLAEKITTFNLGPGRVGLIWLNPEVTPERAARFHEAFFRSSPDLEGKVVIVGGGAKGIAGTALSGWLCIDDNPLFESPDVRGGSPDWCPFSRSESHNRICGDYLLIPKTRGVG